MEGLQTVHRESILIRLDRPYSPQHASCRNILIRWPVPAGPVWYTGYKHSVLSRLWPRHKTVRLHLHPRYLRSYHQFSLKAVDMSQVRCSASIKLLHIRTPPHPLHIATPTPPPLLLPVERLHRFSRIKRHLQPPLLVKLLSRPSTTLTLPSTNSPVHIRHKPLASNNHNRARARRIIVRMPTAGLTDLQVVAVQHHAPT